MKTYKKCNGSYQDGSNFCLICGEKLVHREPIDGVFDVQSGEYEEGEWCVDRNGKTFMVVRATRN